MKVKIKARETYHYKCVGGELDGETVHQTEWLPLYSITEVRLKQGSRLSVFSYSVRPGMVLVPLVNRGQK